MNYADQDLPWTKSWLEIQSRYLPDTTEFPRHPLFTHHRLNLFSDER